MRLFYTQDRAEHFTKQYIKADTSNTGAVRQTEKLLWIQTQFHTLGGGQLRESMLSISVQGKQIASAPFPRQTTVSLDGAARCCFAPNPPLDFPLPWKNWLLSSPGSHDSLHVFKYLLIVIIWLRDCTWLPILTRWYSPCRQGLLGLVSIYGALTTWQTLLLVWGMEEAQALPSTV